MWQFWHFSVTVEILEGTGLEIAPPRDSVQLSVSTIASIEVAVGEQGMVVVVIFSEHLLSLQEVTVMVWIEESTLKSEGLA